MKKKFTKILLSITVPTFLVLGTLGIYFYAKGYRINIGTKEIERTGVISVISEPKRADIKIDDEKVGRTPKAVPGITEGTHTITVSKQGYFDWSTEINVKIEQSIPIHATLFLKSPEIEIIFPDDNDIDESGTNDTSTEQPYIQEILFDDKNRIAVFTVLTTPELNPAEELAEAEDTIDDTPTTSQSLQIWTYPINKRFWQFYTRPQMIAEFSSTLFGLNDINLQVSPDTQKLLVEIFPTEEQLPHYYILDTSTTNSEPAEIPNLTNSNEVPPTWTNDSQYIVISKDNELISLNIDTGARTIIAEKDDEQEFVWTSDDEGLIYYVEEYGTYYDVHRIHNNGENKTTILEDIELPVKRELFETTALDTNDVGQIQSISVSEDGKNIVIFHKQEIHIHSTLSDDFDNILAKEPVFISFSPNPEDMFLYLDNRDTQLKIYTLSIEDGDPVHSIGSEVLLDLKPEIIYSNFRWCPKALNILYSSRDTENAATGTDSDMSEDVRIPSHTPLHAISLDGHNMFEVFDSATSNKFS
ncbi:MAG: PEGA domain-containing protein, partial [Patescibacteria group bacterium]|nr:PEGA domain-containing protein [Patescibacteria group bacterium]